MIAELQVIHERRLQRIQRTALAQVSGLGLRVWADFFPVHGKVRRVRIIDLEGRYCFPALTVRNVLASGDRVTLDANITWDNPP